MGGNAVLGYHQNFDMEGDSGLVARTFGTCVLIQTKEIVPIESFGRGRSKSIDHGHDDHAIVSANSPRQEMARNTGESMQKSFWFLFSIASLFSIVFSYSSHHP